MIYLAIALFIGTFVNLVGEYLLGRQAARQREAGDKAYAAALAERIEATKLYTATKERIDAEREEIERRRHAVLVSLEHGGFCITTLGGADATPAEVGESVRASLERAIAGRDRKPSKGEPS